MWLKTSTAKPVLIMDTFSPMGAWIALTIQTTILFTYGYYAFCPWSGEAFFQNYAMQIVAAILFFGWKIAKRTK